MTLKSYIWGMRFISLITLAALGAVIVYVDPKSSGFMGLFLFYLIAFFALSSLFNLFLIFLRRKLIGAEATAENMGLSFRQAMLLSIMALGIIIFQQYRMLVWWDGLLIVAGVFLIELYFLSRS